ncbi:MAG: diguanylate cyclase [Actinobacteria bacterium]|nr:MAG: diguanylate cyclase [Actinomycetota bacterium]
MSESAAARRSLFPVVIPVCVAGLATVVAAALSFGMATHSVTVLAGLAAFLGASLLADRFPVPVDDLDANGVSLAFVFGLSAIVLFGWAAGVLVVSATPAVMQLLERRPAVRIAYNSFAFALTAASAGLVISAIGGVSPAETAARVVVATYVCYVVNVLLITAVVARATRSSWAGVIASSVRKTILPFTLMGSAVLTLVVLWQRAPLLSVALVGPLLAIQLYQRALLRALRAVRLALTDPLTGLGNHRHFHERLARELEHALRYDRPLALCLVDVDDFKRVNDRFGHPAGDSVLSQVSARLRQTGEAFRLGGDEFAVLLPGFEAPDALTAAESIIDRIATIDFGHMGAVTVSAGIAIAPEHARERDELLRLVDSALYWAKEYGKNRARVYRPDVVELADLRRLASAGDRAGRLRAAASLARAVDARDVYTGNHSQRVAQLAVRLAARLGLSREELELTQLAASLHDVGKLALPEDLLCKPEQLTEPEWATLRQHAQIGFRMLESLGVDPVAKWVLHHHERWDGSGYPDSLAGTEIPVGARIIFVADAFDAMTSDRIYRRRRSRDEALAEILRCAGTQFDPSVVEALSVELGPDGTAAAPELQYAAAV